MRSLMFIVAQVLALIALVAARCEYEDPATGKYFNFDGELTNKDHMTTVSGTADNFSWRFCGTTTLAGPQCKTNNAAFCVKTVASGQAEGVAGWSKERPPQKVTYDEQQKVLRFIFSNIGDMRFNLMLECGAAPGEAVITHSLGSSYSFRMVHPAGCPTTKPADDDGLSGGSIFLIIMLVVVVVYIVVGCIYMHKKVGTALGCDSCPNKGFWFAIPGLAKEGCGFTVAKIKGCFGKQEGSSAGAGSSYGTTEEA